MTPVLFLPDLLPLLVSAGAPPIPPPPPPPQVQPDIEEDYTGYPTNFGGTDVPGTEGTLAFRADYKNIYRAGEDYNIQRQWLVPGAGFGGTKPGLEYRYPAPQSCLDDTVSRGLDVKGLFGSSVKEVWWYLRHKCSDNLVFIDPTCTPPNNGAIAKWMHIGTDGPGGVQRSARIDGYGRQVYGGKAHLYFDIFDPQNTVFANFVAAPFFDGVTWLEWWVHLKLASPIGAGNGLFRCRAPNGAIAEWVNRPYDQTGIRQCSIVRNIRRELSPDGLPRKIIFDKHQVFLQDPGVGI